MKKETLNPKEKVELDKMWPKAEEYLLNERPDGMPFEEYKTRKRHEREMLKFRKKFYGFTPVTKTTKKVSKTILKNIERKLNQKGSKGVTTKTFNRKTA